jgi:hypothetical protein
MANHAVEPPGADEEALCGADDCEAPVFDLYELTAKMAQIDWFNPLDGTIKNQLIGLKLWYIDGMAVPPPHTTTDKEALLSWLERKAGRWRMDLWQPLAALCGCCPTTDGCVAVAVCRRRSLLYTIHT